MAAVRQSHEVRVRWAGNLPPGTEIVANPDSLNDAEYCAWLAHVSEAVWLAEGPPEDAPGLWRLASVRQFFQSRLG